METIILILMQIGSQIIFEFCRWLAIRIKNWALNQIAKSVAEIIMKNYKGKLRVRK